MTNNTALVRSIAIYAICLPLAIILGCMIANPLDKTTIVTLTIVMSLLVLPLLLRWYQAWLITAWNMSITFIYLPGLLPGWMPLAAVGFTIAMGHYILNRERKFLSAPAVSWSLVALALVVLITAKLRGGLGFHAFGDAAVGGKRYFWIWFGVIGYFAIISQPIPLGKRKLYVWLFLMGAGTAAINGLSRMLGPFSNFLNIFFPGMNMEDQIQGDPMAGQDLERFGGLANLGMAVLFTMLALYGIEGILNIRKFWRLILFFATLAASFLGGYRSLVILAGMTVVLAFCFERMWRSRWMPIIVLAVVLGSGFAVCFSEHLPLPVQRCLAVFPLKLNPEAVISAQASSDWRLDIWRSLLPKVPQYLILGKGLTFDANDMEMNLTVQNQVGGDVGGQVTTAGDYHNGPLSLIIPFGIGGVVAFLWFLIASIKVLWANYKYGDPEIKKVNSFLIAYFIAKIILFFFVFGGFYGDIVVFAGLIGVSISVNGGVAKRVPVVAIEPQPVFNRFRRPLLPRPVTSS